ncbi:cytochrome b [Sinorhizobium medicae]|uniref:cytochrome b n=1 Tax=Sinorhizobium medicae TaxID=110321 RepID=UPI002AF6A44E|nr:cytochrome b [Sinorhizobium medicae]WQO46859.1 cytochrome b [Sinorhizobium medicae]WQO64017.1 cytochrome b [Sinorhizobium medicae]WQO74212.1 cytochrome b [Sinorhizobium medicae]WQO93482.1 cytochrome b [Sinorhizobium medicae]
MLRNSKDRFGTVTIVLHWTIAVLILGLLLTGLVMRRTEIDPALQFSLYQWHKSFGFIALGLAALQALRWLVERSPAPPPTLGPMEQMASRAAHLSLIALALLVPLAGWAVASASTLAIPSFFFNLIVIPHLPLPRSETSEAFFALAHATLAYATLALVAVHAAAAIYHHFLRRDEVLVRMLRSGSAPRPDSTISAPEKDDTLVERKRR